MLSGQNLGYNTGRDEKEYDRYRRRNTDKVWRDLFDEI